MKTFSLTLTAYAAISLTLGGCGGETAESSSSATASAEEVDPCSLLSAADIESATGITAGVAESPDPRVNACQWPGPSQEILPLVYLGLSWAGSNTWEEYREYMIEREYGDPEEDGERVDIGLYGHYMPEVAMLQVNTPEHVLITLRIRDGTKAQLVELATKAMERLP